MRRHPQVSLPCAAPDPVRDLIARSDALVAHILKREAWQATRAPVIEHVQTSPAGAYAGPKRKAKAKHDAQAVQDLIRESGRQADFARKAAGSLQHFSSARISFSTLLNCWSEFVSSSQVFSCSEEGAVGH